MSQPDQTGVVRFLEGPMAYTPAPPCVERLETHGALVFLAGDVALKIKKSLRFSYMDFSTLELRRRACLRELEINRPHAPDIYLDVVAITREVGDRLAIGGRGEPVEWCVRMRRFAQSDLLSAKAEAGELDPGLCHRLAEAVLAYHRTAPRIAVADSGDRLARIADDICRQLLAHAPSLGSADVDRLGEQLRRHLLMTKPILSMRDRNGFVRRVHGDLHLGNIVLWKGAPVLFDAIEFDEEIATIDTLYDLAFLLMDLDHRGQRPAANRILNHYLWRSDDVADLEALAAMPLFLALRAGVRSMVLAQRAQQEKAAPRQDDLARARRYLLRAIEYLAPVEPILVAVGGLSGTGKSTLAARLAPKLGAAPGALHLRSDLERKALFGAAETEPLPAAAYSPEAGARVYATLTQKAGLLISRR